MPAIEPRLNGEVTPKVASVPAVQYPVGFQQLTSLSAAQALTPPAGARIAIIHSEAQAVRWRDDGTAPTAVIGMRLPGNSELRYDGNLAAVRLVEEATGAKLNVAYYA